MKVQVVVELNVDESRITKKDKEKLDQEFEGRVRSQAGDSDDAKWYSTLKCFSFLKRSKMRAIKIEQMEDCDYADQWKNPIQV
jgi:hypothetical protein